MHLAFNMFGLYIFGRPVARALGTGHLLHLYVVGAIMASLGHVAFGLATGDATPALGASGAVMALAVVFAALHPDTTILVGFFLPMPAWAAVAGFILLDVVGTFSPGSSIAHAAHLGGAAYGLLFWYIKLRQPPRPRFRKGTYGTRL